MAEDQVITAKIKSASSTVNSDNAEAAATGHTFDISFSTTITIPNPAYVPPDPDAVIDPNAEVDPNAFVAPETLSKEVSFTGSGELTNGSDNVLTLGNGIARLDDEVKFSSNQDVTFDVPFDPQYNPANPPEITSKTVSVTMTGNGHIKTSGTTVFANDRLVSRVDDEVELTLQTSIGDSTGGGGDSGGSGNGGGGTTPTERIETDWYGNRIVFL